jgi:hypothetical protein
MTNQKQDPEGSTSAPSPEQTKRMLRESAAAMVASLNRGHDDEADKDAEDGEK